MLAKYEEKILDKILVNNLHKSTEKNIKDTIFKHITFVKRGKYNHLNGFWVGPPRSQHIYRCLLGHISFLVSLCVGEGGPAKAVETTDGAPLDTVPWSVGTRYCQFLCPSSALGGHCLCGWRGL